MSPARPQIAIKVDVDTDRGTREGVPALVELLQKRGVPATFLFSLGPDNTGKAIRRIFRPGFLKKVRRTRVTSHYGWRTLLSGTLLPAPMIGKRNEAVLRGVKQAGFEVGIHCHDHFRWQDYLHTLSCEEVRSEFGKAATEFERIFKAKPLGAGAPGWQASANSFQVYDEHGLLYGSDCRGESAFFPRAAGRVFATLQIPTTLPTLDELLGRPEFPEGRIVPHYLSLLRADALNVITVHAELEGMQLARLFGAMVESWQQRDARFSTLEQVAEGLLKDRSRIPVCDVRDVRIDGRSGTLSCQTTSSCVGSD